MPKPAPNYDPSRLLSGPEIAGYLNVRSQMEIDRIRREAEEAMRRQQYFDSNRWAHGNWQDAIDANAGIELGKGLQPCQKGAFKQTGNW